MAVRTLAIDKLGDMNMIQAEEPLMKAADSSDPRVASKAILSLGRMKSAKAVQLAIDHLKSEYLDVKLASIQVIGEMGGANEKSLLAPLLSAESTKVRKTAQDALNQVSSKDMTFFCILTAVSRYSAIKWRFFLADILLTAVLLVVFQFSGPAVSFRSRGDKR